MGRPRKRCAEHGPVSQFKRDGQWTCSICGRQAPWSNTWSYFGSLGCIHCQCEPAIEVVMCSEACRTFVEFAQQKPVRP